MDNFNQTNEQRAEMLQRTDEGINNSFINAHDKWRFCALECLKEVALSKERFTVDDVRSLVSMSGLHTHDNRAMGGVIKTGVKNGWIIATGQTVPSVVGHKIPMQIWKSLIVKEVCDK